MADYKELLRRAIAALPENNGAARRAVYEKARAALVGQLRAITPPLPARDITQHRLQLEDCIRQVEQEASEAVITLGREPLASVLAAQPPPEPTRPATPPPIVETPRPAPASVQPVRPVEPPRAVEVPRPVDPPPVEESAAADTPAPQSAPSSIEDIISEAAAVADVAVVPVAAEAEPEAAKPETTAEIRPLPTAASRGQASRTGPLPAAPVNNVRPIDAGLKGPSFEPRREAIPPAANTESEPHRVAARAEPSIGGQAVARQQVATPSRVLEPVAVEAALSSVREVEVEVEPDASAAQDVIERAIEVLDREARGEPAPALPDPVASNSFAQAPAELDDNDDAGFAEASGQRGGAGLTIFLVVFAVLLAGVGGAGFWAWREGYVDLEQMFGQTPVVTETAVVTPPTTPTLDPVQTAPGDSEGAAGPGNTAPSTAADQPNAELSGLEIDDRLEPTPTPVQPTGAESVLPDIGSGGDDKTEERLPGQDTAAVATNDIAASVDPAILAGSQSLLLEASQDGTAGAVPFSGTVEWTEGVDEIGLPTLLGTASIPARNLGVDITIRKNSDPSLPASHLMEVDFRVSDTFIGGTIATLPGILLKDQELVPGTALIGASARVVGNSFLFALSATPADSAINTDLLENRRWMDLAVVYGTGRNAILTLEKDEEAQALFDKVFSEWAQ
jgi:hypothetical protein